MVKKIIVGKQFSSQPRFNIFNATSRHGTYMQKLLSVIKKLYLLRISKINLIEAVQSVLSCFLLLGFIEFSDFLKINLDYLVKKAKWEKN